MKRLILSVSIKDCDVQAYRGPGAGGQKKNKTSSGIRVVHEPSGARGQCHDNREQSRNKREAFLKMIETKEFKIWHLLEIARQFGTPTLEEVVDKELEGKNLKIEIKDPKGNWIVGDV